MSLVLLLRSSIPAHLFDYSESANVWSPPDGVWLVWWMRYQIFAPLFLLQLLNLFWYFLIWRVAYRCVSSVSRITQACLITVRTFQGPWWDRDSMMNGAMTRVMQMATRKIESNAYDTQMMEDGNHVCFVTYLRAFFSFSFFSKSYRDLNYPYRRKYQSWNPFTSFYNRRWLLRSLCRSQAPCGLIEMSHPPAQKSLNPHRKGCVLL